MRTSRLWTFRIAQRYEMNLGSLALSTGEAEDWCSTPLENPVGERRKKTSCFCLERTAEKENRYPQ